MRAKAIVLFLLLLAFAFAQSVREVGMGGVSLPGPGSSWANPAYAAAPARFDRGTWSVPLGLLGLLLPDRSPLYYFAAPDAFYSSFDLLSFYDQIAHLDAFLINPARSPAEVVLKVSQGEGGELEFRLEDGEGHPIRLGAAKDLAPPRPLGLTPPPFLNLPFSLGQGFAGEVGLFAGVDRLSLAPDAKLAALLAGGSLAPNETYTLTAEGAASAGVSLGFAFSQALPPLPEVPGTLFVGARGEGFLGLARFESEVTTSFTTDASGKPAETRTSTRLFYSYLGQGIGYGVRLDLGLAYADASGVYGLGVRNLASFARWQGIERVDDDGGSTEQPRTETFAGLAPAFYLSGAGYVPLEQGEKLLVAADLAYDGAISGHLGVEYPIQNLALRAGIGYEAGLKLGLGLGLDLAALKLDLALTSHTAPLTGGQVFGVTAAVGF